MVTVRSILTIIDHYGIPGVCSSNRAYPCRQANAPETLVRYSSGKTFFLFRDRLFFLSRKNSVINKREIRVIALTVIISTRSRKNDANDRMMSIMFGPVFMASGLHRKNPNGKYINKKEIRKVFLINMLPWDNGKIPDRFGKTVLMTRPDCRKKEEKVLWGLFSRPGTLQ